MRVLLDNGVYRHIQMKKPGSSNMWFDIVTWPGFLAYSGDMGAFVFSRLNDMFEFFRSSKDGTLQINPDYWGEKLEAIDSDGRSNGYKQFSIEKMRRHVEEDIKMWIEECPTEFEADEEEESNTRKAFEVELRTAVQDEVYYYFDDGESAAQEAVRDFSFTPTPKRFIGTHGPYEFSETWEWDCDEYTLRFIWCCYAIAWTIRKYDAAKEVA